MLYEQQGFISGENFPRRQFADRPAPPSALSLGTQGTLWGGAVSPCPSDLQAEAGWAEANASVASSPERKNLFRLLVPQITMYQNKVGPMDIPQRDDFYSGEVFQGLSMPGLYCIPYLLLRWRTDSLT